MVAIGVGWGGGDFGNISFSGNAAGDNGELVVTSVGGGHK